MPITFILTIIFAIVTLAVWSGVRASKRRAEQLDLAVSNAEAAADNQGVEHYRSRQVVEAQKKRAEFTPVPNSVIAIPLALTLVLLLFASFTIIPARTVGVVTSFGKPVDSLTSGLNFKAPWEKVTKLDGTIQTNSAIGEAGEGAESEDYDIGDVSIRLGNESIAKVRYTVRWRIVPDKAETLYADYREMANIRESLVTRETMDALNKAFSGFDPLAQVKNNEDAGVADFSKYAEEVKRAIQNSTDGSNIEIRSVSIPLVQYDEATQRKLDDFQTEIAATRVAEQREATNRAQARANRALSESISNEPNVLVAECLTALNEMVRKNQNVPAGFSCWPGGGVEGLLVGPGGGR